MTSPENDSGREPIQIVEIDQDLCVNVYGVSPCNASIGVTGTRKCYNTRATCQDPDNYSLDAGTSPTETNVLTLRFTRPRANLPKDLGLLIPSVTRVTSRPTKLAIGEGLGSRAKITVSLQDHPYHDRIVDPYVTERSFDPTGTFWAKWLTRNPYHMGRPLRIREGYVGQTLAEMRVRHYIIDRIDGPDSRGRIQITAKDLLKLADGDRAMAPVASDGILLVAINTSATQLLLDPAGVGDDYPTSGLIRIGDELMTYTRGSPTDEMTVVRAQNNTTANAHDAGSTVQLCIQYSDTPIADVLYDLLANYTRIDTAFLPKADWDALAATWLSSFNLTGIIAAGTSVRELLGEILTQANAFMWWDEYAQQVKFDSIHPPLATPVALSDDANLVADQTLVKRLTADRISQVWVYYDQIDPTEGARDPSNYHRLRIFIDANAESAFQYNDSRMRMLFARFLDGSNDAEVLGVGNRLLSRYRDTPQFLSFSLDAKDRTLNTGDLAEITSRFVLDDTGAPLPTQFLITERDERDAGHLVRYVAQTFPFSVRYGFVAPNATPDFPSATDAEKSTYGWISDNAGRMADGTEAYRII